MQGRGSSPSHPPLTKPLLSPQPRGGPRNPRGGAPGHLPHPEPPQAWAPPPPSHTGRGTGSTRNTTLYSKRTFSLKKIHATRPKRQEGKCVYGKGSSRSSLCPKGRASQPPGRLSLSEPPATRHGSPERVALPRPSQATSACTRPRPLPHHAPRDLPEAPLLRPPGTGPRVEAPGGRSSF